MKYVTHSELKTFKRCRRKWWLSYFRKLALVREDPTSAAKLGTLVHGALEIIYTPSDERDPIRWLRDRVHADLAEFPDKAAKIEKQGKLADAMVEGYVEWLAETGADEDLEVISAETTVEAPLIAPELNGRSVMLRGKMDLRVRRISDGATLFLDHKTVQSFEERIRLLHLDEQMKMYHLLEYLSAPEAQRTDGALYNMLRKVLRSARAKPPFYEREEVRHNVHVLRSYWRQVVGEVLEILAVEDELRRGTDHVSVVPPNPTRDCSWDCQFLPVCPMFDDSSAAAERVIHSYYTETDPLARYAEKDAE